MKTIDALKDYRHKSGNSGTKISKLIGVTESAVNAWLRDETVPQSYYLLRLQEFLLEQRYTLDDLGEMPEYMKSLRKLMFQNKLTPQELMQKLSFSRIKRLWDMFRTKDISANKAEICVTLVARLSPASQEFVSITSFEGEVESEMDLKIREALEVFVGPLKHFLKTSSSSERHALRKKHPNLFQASNILSATCSNKAYETWINEN